MPYKDPVKRETCQLRYERKRSKQFIKFKGRRLYIRFDPKIGVCNLCRAVIPFDSPMTNIHHDQGIYYENDPLKNTIEICVGCHTKESIKLGQISVKRGRIRYNQKCIFCGSKESYPRRLKSGLVSEIWFFTENGQDMCARCRYERNKKIDRQLSRM